MNIRRCFEILEINMGASSEEVKKAHKDLVFIWHPDRVTSKNPRLKQKAEKKLKEINAAYTNVLSFLSENPGCYKTTKHKSDNEPEEETSAPSQDTDEADKVSVYFRQGIAYGEANKHRQAIKSFTKAIRLRPNHANAYYNRGVAYNNTGNYKRAIKDFTQAVHLDPNYSLAYIYRGYIYADLDDFERACSDFQKAYELGNSVGTEWARKRGFCL
ncbi:J domain-containing protein [Desulfonema magnum]|uniref:DnaJ domain-containing protein, tetratricopeptide repeat-containing n=1 Tax=Desulfonema magnum TaxID=45655 RepID=A0A975GLK1_9BACT|nr:tetratricopeptide repeat protein [Desulfonema magnum]QTA85931.1 DnaJ domain-containing protein, tetratricopeptide repeat-containing [Desulfonema magnum]